MPDEAVKFMESVIPRQASVLEFGSGGSTIWFARRAKKVVSFEHDAGWHEALRITLKKRRLKNVDLILDPEYIFKGCPELTEKFDIILVDPIARINGRIIQSRFLCVRTSYENLKPGGYLFLDDANNIICKEAVEFLRSLGWEEKFFWTGHKAAAWKKPL